jgi:hypothetical protein
MVNALAEWSREVEKARAETREMVSAALGQAVRLLGVAEATAIWGEVLKREGGKRGEQGRPKGAAKPDRDAAMLAYYDYWMDHHPDDKSRRHAISFVGQYLAHVRPREFGRNPPSIARHLRRLVVRRKSESASIGNALAVLARTGRLPEVDLP